MYKLVMYHCRLTTTGIFFIGPYKKYRPDNTKVLNITQGNKEQISTLKSLHCLLILIFCNFYSPLAGFSMGLIM